MFKKESFTALRVVEFAKHLSARFLITIAYQMQTVALSWWIYQKTQNPLYLGLIGLVEALPALGVSLFAGYWADKYNRKKIIFYSILFITLCNALTLLVLLSNSISLKWILIFLFSLIFLIGLARGIMGPSNFAFISQLVSKEQLPNAATWNSFSWQLSMIIGPVVATSLIAFWGMRETEFVILFFSLCSVFIYRNIQPLFKAKIAEHNEAISAALKNGVSFVFKHPILLGALSLDMLAVLFGGTTAILPAYTSEVLKEGPEVLGYLRSAPAVGSVLMMLFLAGNPPLKNTGKLLFLSVGLFGVFTLAFALTNNLGLALLFLFLTGAFDAISVIIRGTILQLYTPDNMRGRVSAVNTIFIGSSNELGAFESGFTASLMGIIPSILFGGSVTLVVVIVFAFKFKTLLKLELREKTGN